MYVSHSYSHFLFYSHPVDSRLLWSIPSLARTRCAMLTRKRLIVRSCLMPTRSHVCVCFILRVTFRCFVSQYRSCCKVSNCSIVFFFSSFFCRYFFLVFLTVRF